MKPIIKHPNMQRFTHGKRYERIYRIWRSMKKRCNNTNLAAYKRYGGRGIKVCDEWNDSFQAFDSWAMSHGYADNLTIDRINVNGNYCPENCRWVTYQEQANNRRTNVLVTIGNETKTIAQWAAENNLKYDTVWRRFKNGVVGVDLIRGVANR